jgi:PKD repeat protein
MNPIFERHPTRPSATFLLLAGLAMAFLAVALTAGFAGAAPNLYLDADDISPEADQPTKGTTCDIDVTVGNDGDANATGFYVKLRDVTAGSDIGTIGPFNVSSSASITVTFTWDLTGAASGKHTLRAVADSGGDVTESDEEDNSADKDVTVNLPPTAKATSSVGFAYTITSIGFSGSGSNDPDGRLVKYLWYFGDGSVGEGRNVTHSYNDGSPSPGKTYNITLVVTDEDGGAGSHTITVRIYNRLPEAAASDASVSTVTPLSISGSGSSDSDGKVVRFRWTLHNGTQVWGSPLVVIYDDDGQYGISLTVWDDDGESDSTSLTVTVYNQAPMLDFSVNKTLVAIDESIRFDGSGSYDVDGTITNMTWIFGDSTTATGFMVDHSYSQNGSYNTTVIAVDDDGAVTYKTVRIIVGNTAPLAVARASEGYVLTFVDVEFNATSSSDEDDNIASFAWDFGDGYSAMGSVVSHNFSDDGTYVVTLTVTDTGGIYGLSTVTIVVGNREPVVGFNDLTVMTRETAHFNGTLCWDMDGYIASFMWDLGAGLIYTAPNATHSWESPGLYVVKLKIWDDDGATNETTFNVTVLNRSPVAVMTADPVKTTLAKPVHFNGTGSYDTDGEIINWTWTFGDGVKDYGEEVDHTYSVYGTYLATLTVRDESGGINTTGVLITVRNQPPVALMNVSAVTALTGEAIHFDGSNSTDPENQIANYYWSFGDGESDTGPKVIHTYADDGWYTVRLTVVDEDSTSSYVEVIIKVLNRLPEAKAQVDPTTVKTHEDVTFSGASSKDEDGTVLWFRWDFGDGNLGFGESVVHAYSDDGIYTATLTLTDDDGAEAFTTIDVTVVNRAPVSVAGDDALTRTGIPIRFDGRGSYDMDGTVALYHWDFGDETSAEGPVVNHAFPTYGTFTVVLTVTDDDGDTASSNLTVTVENVQPVASITGDTRVQTGEPMELDGSSSYDLDGNIVEYRWDLGDGTGQEVGPIIEHSYAKFGLYLVTLTVEDDGGLTSSISIKVEVLNRRPSAAVSASITVLPTGDTVNLDGAGSSDPDGTVETYTWILGDGSVAHGSRVSHVYVDDGIYMVVLTVTDNDGGTDSSSVFIQVENRQPLPAIDAPTQSLTLTEVDLTAEGTMDPDGVVFGYFWDFGDGAGDNGWNVTHEYTTSGTYTIRLTVMDDDGRTATTSVTIDIINRPPEAMAEAPIGSMQNSTVKFDASGSYDSDGILSTWEWDFGDDRTGEGRIVYHRYLEVGSYSWVLTVTDDSGESAEFNGTISINQAPDEPDVPDIPDEPSDDEGLLPGPGAFLALATLALVTALMSARRRRRS